MNYAELTDDELRLEVARRCGEVCYINDESDIHHIVPGNGVTAYIPVPDYPHDLTAAIALLESTNLEYDITKGFVRNPEYIVIIWAMGRRIEATADTLPRAACEAWLMWDDARKEAQG